MNCRREMNPENRPAGNSMAIPNVKWIMDRMRISMLFSQSNGDVLI